MTAAAMLAAFYFRFEDIGLGERFHWLLVILPGYLVVRRRRLLDLQPLCRQVALRVVAGPVEHFPRRDGAGVVAAGARLRPGLRRISTAPSSSARLPLRSTGCCRCSFSVARASPTACSGTRARSTMPEVRKRSRRWSPGAPRTPKSCCAPSRAALSPRSGRSASCRRLAPIRASRCAAFRYAAI